jgi:hypothetical protein
LKFLRQILSENDEIQFSIPLETYQLLEKIQENLQKYQKLDKPEQNFLYWDAVSDAREKYRSNVFMGVDGEEVPIHAQTASEYLDRMILKTEAGIKLAFELNDGLPPTYFYYLVKDFEIIRKGNQQPTLDPAGRPTIRIKAFEPKPLPLFLEGFTRALKIASAEKAESIYIQAKASALYDQKLRMYKVNAALDEQPHSIGRARAFTPGWLENESIWLHMEYKFLLEVLKAGLYEYFYEDFRNVIIPFLNPAIYGRSTTENSSFLVSSAHPDPSLHGTGFVARLSGSTAEFLSIWMIMMAGRRPFVIINDNLCLKLSPILPGWLFKEDGTLSFTFLGKCLVTYHNPQKANTYDGKTSIKEIILQLKNGKTMELNQAYIPNPYANMVRDGEISTIDIFYQ